MTDPFEEMNRLVKKPETTSGPVISAWALVAIARDLRAIRDILEER